MPPQKRTPEEQEAATKVHLEKYAAVFEENQAIYEQVKAERILAAKADVRSVWNLADALAYAANHWHEFEGGDQAAMAGFKVSRAENPKWEAPLLTFTIERHGAIVGGGGSRAELQDWTVNLVDMTADYVPSGRRQVYAMSPRWDATSAAQGVAAAILADADHEDIERCKTGSIRLHAVPYGYRQTTGARSRRFYAALMPLIEPAGWYRSGSWLKKVGAS